MKPIEIEESRRLIAGYFDLDEAELGHGTRFATDLGFDSLQLYELWCLIEEAVPGAIGFDDMGADLSFAEIVARLRTGRLDDNG